MAEAHEGMTEMEKLRAGMAYRYDDPELVEMKDMASLRCSACFWSSA